ncbi:MAG: flagellar export protein FliJ [Lachnospiraceae bacterium]|nr:flagellar export protein FliJ [Lachnospiraceae bacterium]
MARFIFKLESILSIKEKLETQAKVEFGIEMARLREEEEKLEAMRLRKEEFQRRLTGAVQNQLNIRQIKDLEDAVENVKYNMRLQRVVIREQEARVELAREKMNEAMKERKTYERLKEKAFEEFLKELDKAERKEVDELVSFRYQNAVESED